MNTHFLFHQIRISGLSRSARKVLRRLISPYQAARALRRATQQSTRLPRSTSPAALRRLLSLDSLAGMKHHSADLLEACDHYVRHEFPVAGVGWLPVHHRTDVPGIASLRYSQEAFPYEIDADGEWIAHLVNASNVKDSQDIWRRIDQPYTAMDWQRDLRSGYVWSEGQWHSFLSLGNGKGVDPKSTWDLGRMHAALHLALGLHCSDERDRQVSYFTALRSLLLDFLALNPPGFGIQWKSPMDVAIRLANICVAIDLTRLYRELDEDFLDVVTRAVHEHARFVLDHLEWSDGMRANHYLSNLAGLAAAAAYLEDCPLRSSVVSLLKESLPEESHLQFLPDGGNFEASLPYHRLSAEMLCWAWSFASQCEELRFLADSEDIATILGKVLSFSRNTSYRSICMPQIGDHDSGRFLPLLPFHWTPQQADRPFDMRALCTLLEGFVGMPPHGDLQPEFFFIRTLRARLDAPEQSSNAVARTTFFTAPDFGLWRYSGARYDVLLRAGGIGQHGKGGHAHNDQLSLCLAVDGLEFFADPGTYVYTALPEERNRFRSTAMHNVLQLDHREQNTWSVGTQEMLFWLMGDRARAQVSEASEHRWSARHEGYGCQTRRRVDFAATHLDITDECDSDDEKVLRFLLRPECSISSDAKGALTISRAGVTVLISSSDAVFDIVDSRYSPEYGAVMNTKCVELRSRLRVLHTHIEICESTTV